jgi:ABC-2 type transport system permease protein
VVAFLVVGGLIGCYADTPESAAAISNFLMVPMAFLSGSFIPLESLPVYLQQVSRVLPLRYLNDGVLAALTGVDAVPAAATAVAVLLGFAAVGSVVLLRVFRWSARS